MNIKEKLNILETDFRLVFGTTKIDYDTEKDDANREKHGYALESGVFLIQQLLLPAKPVRFATHDAFTKNGEVRHKHMCQDDEGNVVFMVTTMRSEETVRVISLRRASKEERLLFDELCPL